jgi:hypothetical protein
MRLIKQMKRGEHKVLAHGLDIHGTNSGEGFLALGYDEYRIHIEEKEIGRLIEKLQDIRDSLTK